MTGKTKSNQSSHKQDKKLSKQSQARQKAFKAVTGKTKSNQSSHRQDKKTFRGVAVKTKSIQSNDRQDKKQSKQSQARQKLSKQ